VLTTSDQVADQIRTDEPTGTYQKKLHSFSLPFITNSDRVWCTTPAPI
jgi:hypothetical protein